MGLCCGRQTNEFEVLFDDFFNKMNITNEGSDKIYEIIIDNLNDKNKWRNSFWRNLPWEI